MRINSIADWSRRRPAQRTTDMHPSRRQACASMYTTHPPSTPETKPPRPPLTLRRLRRPAVLSEVPSGFFLFAAFRVSRGNFERELEEDPWSASPLTILGAMCGRGSPLTASIPGPACSLAGGWRPSGRWQARAGAPACTAPAAAGPRPVVLEVPEQFFKDAHMHTLKGSACVAPARRGGWYGGEADVFRKRSCITHADESCESSCF